MSVSRFHRTWLTLLATLFFALQSTAIGHAAQYGDGQHDHNGIVCTVDAIAADQHALMPVPVAVPTPMPEFTASYFPSIIAAPVMTPPGRAPPPRSPPTLSD